MSPNGRNRKVPWSDPWRGITGHQLLRFLTNPWVANARVLATSGPPLFTKGFKVMNETMISKIEKLRKDGLSQEKIAKKLSIGTGSVSRVCKKISYRAWRDMSLKDGVLTIDLKLEK
jgi:hypothetical protein